MNPQQRVRSTRQTGSIKQKNLGSPRRIVSLNEAAVCFNAARIKSKLFHFKRTERVISMIEVRGHEFSFYHAHKFPGNDLIILFYYRYKNGFRCTFRA